MNKCFFKKKTRPIDGDHTYKKILTTIHDFGFVFAPRSVMHCLDRPTEIGKTISVTTHRRKCKRQNHKELKIQLTQCRKCQTDAVVDIWSAKASLCQSVPEYDRRTAVVLRKGESYLCSRYLDFKCSIIVSWWYMLSSSPPVRERHPSS